MCTDKISERSTKRRPGAYSGGIFKDYLPPCEFFSICYGFLREKNPKTPLNFPVHTKKIHPSPLRIFFGPMY